MKLPRNQRDSVRFGYLLVPRDHANPGGPRFRIAVAILPARTPRPESDPVVFIVGGPGLPGIEQQLRLRGARPIDVYRSRRAVIIIDPRAHGYSEPRMCPRLRGAARDDIDALADCREQLSAQGVNLSHLSSLQVAHDLEFLRRALGVPQLNLFGSSYGTRIAVEALRQLPRSIRAVFLLGPVPPGRFRGPGDPAAAWEALDAVIRSCAAQPACRVAYPHLRQQYRTEMAPIAHLLTSREHADIVPLIMRTIAEQDAGLLDRIAPRLTEIARAGHGVAGTGLAYWCNDGVVDQASSRELKQRCREWIGANFREREAQPVRSDVPALIAAGEFDPLTPPSYAHDVAEGLAHAQVLVIPEWGHGQPPECIFRISSEFFDGPGNELDTSCLSTIPGVAYITRPMSSRAISEAISPEAERPWLLLTLSATALLAMLALSLWLFARKGNAAHASGAQ
ncbi:MAG TPA: alpha/beta fold hydrolase [Longimicrobiales bacterium]|nr:alpha/beta fold hydrolase [Longimicrobiales bacterium]